MILLECWKERESIKAHECELSSMGSLQESQRCRLCGEETEAENDIFGTSLQVDLRRYRGKFLVRNLSKGWGMLDLCNRCH